MSAAKAVENVFYADLQKKAEIVNGVLSRILAEEGQIEPYLGRAIRYTLESPGKRLRAAIVLWCCEVVSGAVNHSAETAAAAIEMVHTYSLVHDDLPAMDNDDMRRGQPACHKAFDEPTAILAGDALLTMAFKVLAEQINGPEVAVRLIASLASAAGPVGMIGGQMADLRAEKTRGSEEQVRTIHTNKTARMFSCAAAMGAICGGAGEKELEHLCNFGLKTGLVFQIGDDILDVCGTSEQTGKTAGKDAQAGKVTYPSTVGLEKSRQMERELADEAIEELKIFGSRAEVLRQLVAAMLSRTG